MSRGATSPSLSATLLLEGNQTSEAMIKAPPSTKTASKSTYIARRSHCGVDCPELQIGDSVRRCHRCPLQKLKAGTPAPAVLDRTCLLPLSGAKRDPLNQQFLHNRIDQLAIGLPLETRHQHLHHFAHIFGCGRAHFLDRLTRQFSISITAKLLRQIGLQSDPVRIFPVRASSVTPGVLRFLNRFAAFFGLGHQNADRVVFRKLLSLIHFHLLERCHQQTQRLAACAYHRTSSPSFKS